MTTFVLLSVFYATVVITDGSSKLIFANRYNICTLDAKANQSSPNLVITGLEDVAALDFLYDEQMVYWTDITQEKIRAARLGGSLSTADVVTTGLVSPDGLACDWVTRKLYWVDSETNRIEVCSLNGTIRKVLVWQELDQPRALALDPRNGYMYWTDWGETAKIERMGMDGAEGSRSILVSSNIFWPNGLTLDYDENRMFWTDARLHYIHSANLDGSDRRIIIHNSLPHPFAITLSEEAIYWTDWHLRAIFTCDKTNGANIRMITDELNLPMDIHVMEARRQPSVVSPCGRENGGCSDLCLLSPWSPFFSCQCPTGIRLLQDNRTCDHGPNEMLLLVRRTDIRLISLDTPDHTDLTLDIRNVRHAIALDYDPVDQMVYWTDDELHAIRRSKLDGTEMETVVDVEVYNPDGIAVDWVARNLYWTDAGTDRIQVSRLNGSSRRVIIADRLQEPRAIILDPAAGQMYWTDWGDDTKIEQSNLDGSDRLTLVNTSIGWPNGLAIDRQQRKLYWADAKLDRIEYMNLDGSGRRILISENLPHIFGFTLLGDFVYWTDWQRRAIESVHKSNAKQRTVIIDQLPDVMGLTAVNVSFYEGENSCSHGNGGCSHLCLYRAQGSAVCACPFGMELLSSDEKTCTVPEAFILYSTQSEVHMVSLDSPDRDTVIPLHRLKNVVDIQYSVSDGRLYWIDISNKVIARVFVNGSSEQVVVSSGLESPESLAVDHLAQNLYWADYGTGRIEMARDDGSLRRVLVWTDNKPQALVLVPNRGYMFWSNVVNSPRIERATLDGSERQVIVTGLGQVNSMTLDPTEGRLYWTNSDRGRIESCDLDGSSRVDIVVGLDQPFGLAQHGQHIYWIERYSHNIYRAAKTNGADRRLLVSSPVFPMAVTVFHTALNSGWSSCRLHNGGCSHLCILDVRRSEVQLSTHHCSCAAHFSLSSDNRTCDASDSVMLLSLKNSVLQLSFGEFADSIDMLLPIPPKTMHGIQALDFNPVDNYIYWIDGRTKSVRKIHNNGSDMVLLRQNLPGHDAISPYDLVLSPQDRLLYWSDAKRNVISGMHLDGTNIGVIVNDTMQKPRHLAMASESSLIFWTNVLPHLQSIECAGADGTRHRTIFSSRFGRLGPIVTDEELKKIFWADLEFRTIESGDFDGTNRSVLVESIPEPAALAVHGEHLYWISKDTKSLERVNKYTGHGRMTLKTRLSQLSDLVIVRRRRLKASSRNPCSGKCSHLCIRDTDGMARCACPLGMVLHDDEGTCAPLHTCSEDQFSCLSGTNLCIPITWKCDGEPDCKDGSDEVNCSSCSSTHFRCLSGDCIPLEHQCNGRTDCPDRSDELKCPPCVQNTLGCANDRTCFVPSQRCNKIVDCWDGFDEMNCAAAGGANAKTHYTVVIIGIICGVLIVVVILTAVYIFRGKNNKCAKVYNDNSLILVAQNTDSLVMEGKSTSTRSGIAPLILSSQGRHLDDVGWSCEHISDTFTLMSGISQYPKHAIDPHPTPVTTEGDGSTTVNSSSLTLRVKRPHRHRHKRPLVPLHPTPCSTDVCDDSDLQGGCDAHFLSSTETGFETDLNPHPPSPCSQFMSEASSSCPPSPSTQRNLYLPILDLTYNRATNCL